MRTKAHWDECKELASYHSAQNLAFQLRDSMKSHKCNLNNLKVYSKEEVNKHGGYADAQVVWQEGPEDWTQRLSLVAVPGVHVEVEDEYTVSFYDI
jgi:hypothetical protein